MVISAVLAAVIAAVACLAGMNFEAAASIGGLLFLAFSFNNARAEVEELKLILDEEAPGWQERNAAWTSTWDWSRLLKRRARRGR